MKVKRFFDQNFFVPFVISLALILVYLFISTNVIEFLFRPWDPRSPYASLGDYIKYLYSYTKTLYASQFIFQFMVPIFSGIAAIRFYSIKMNYFPFLCTRIKSYKKLLIAEMFESSLKIALACFTSYLLIYTVINLLQSPDFSSVTSFWEGQSSAYLSDVFGERFYFEHPRIFYLLDGLTSIFYAIFVCSFLGCSFALVLDKKFKVYLSVLFYYYGLTILLNRVPMLDIQGFNLNLYLRYLEPARITSAKTLLTNDTLPSTALLFVGNVLPILIISYLCIRKALQQDKERII